MTVDEDSPFNDQQVNSSTNFGLQFFSVGDLKHILPDLYLWPYKPNVELILKKQTLSSNWIPYILVSNILVAWV